MNPFRSTGVVSLLLTATALAAPPPAKKEPVNDTYHGDSVVDPYRWLQDGNSKTVQAWSEAQNAYARAYLDKLPGVETIRGRVKELLEAKTITHYHLQWRDGRLFAMKRQPPKQQPF